MEQQFVIAYCIVSHKPGKQMPRSKLTTKIKDREDLDKKYLEALKYALAEWDSEEDDTAFAYLQDNTNDHIRYQPPHKK